MTYSVDFSLVAEHPKPPLAFELLDLPPQLLNLQFGFDLGLRIELLA